MPKHITKMEDGHFLIETDEEYKKRTSGGCLRTIGTIITIIFIGFAFLGKDDESSDKAPATEVVSQESEVKTSAPAKPVEVEKTVTNNNVTYSVEEVEDTPVVIEEPKASNVAAEISAAENSLEAEVAAVDIEASVKRVKELYKSATAAIKDGDIDAALKALEEMKAIQAEMPKKVNRINNKIKSLEKKLN